MHPLRILLIAQDNCTADALQSRLVTDDCQVFHVENFCEALEAVSFQKFSSVVVCPPVDAVQVSEFVSKLRASEVTQKVEKPVSVFLSSTSVAKGVLAAATIDAVIPDSFTVADLLEASKQPIAGLSSSSASTSTASDAGHLPIFLEDKYAEQLGGDPELMVEIIDIFFSEYANQADDLVSAFRQSDFEQVSRLAHTVKGSLSSLQGPRARACAQELETVAKSHDAHVIEPAWRAMESEIEVLRPHLIELHDRLSRP